MIVPRGYHVFQISCDFKKKLSFSAGLAPPGNYETLTQCWPNAGDARPLLAEHCFKVSCSLDKIVQYIQNAK